VPSVVRGQRLEFVKVTGSATIGTIAGSGRAYGRTIKLISSDGTWTFSDSASFQPQGDLVATDRDVLTLATDGNAWWEVARSPN
jgi:hypothetical protein